MSVDERIREGLLLANTELPRPDTTRALESVLTRARSSSRWRVALGVAAAVAAVITGAVVLVPRLGADERQHEPARTPTPTHTGAPSRSAEAERIIDEGHLVGYAMDRDGILLTTWTTCTADATDTSVCTYAWRLGGDDRARGTGLLEDRGAGIRGPMVTPTVNGFVLYAHPEAEGLVTRDGVRVPFTSGAGAECAKTDYWPAKADPGRYVTIREELWVHLVDTVALTSCDTSGWEPNITNAEFSSNGTLWGATGSQVGRYGYGGWRFHDIPAETLERTLIVGGDHAALLARELTARGPTTVAGFTVTIDGGGTWSDADTLPFPRFDSVAAAGEAALLVADLAGNLWRATDWQDFQQLDISTSVEGLTEAGDAVLARIKGTDTLVRITADGTVEQLTAR